MIHIQFDNENNVPEEVVEVAAMRARQFDARLRRIDGIPSRSVAAKASAAAGMIAGSARRFSLIEGRFSQTAIEANPMRADYRAAMQVRGGMQPKDLPWLACERAITGEYDVFTRRVGFQLVFSMKVPPASVTLNLHARADDEAICPDELDATMRCGVAEVPYPLHLPPGMTSGDLAAAVGVMLPTIEKSALALWLQSEGGTKEVF